MNVISNVLALKEHINTWRSAGLSVGFVPTMGALHEGHLSLIRAAKAQNDRVICSIYVNPTQFNNAADLTNYPRTLDEDLRLLETVNCDLVFCPSSAEMYPDGEVSDNINYEFGALELVMEGKFRPGHFQGVATIVGRLFEAVTPDRAYFGEKDYQQLMVIRQMTKQRNYPVTIVACPIVRESDGLAMSSRNMRLLEAIRPEASLIYQCLTNARKWSTSLSTDEVRGLVTGAFAANPHFELEYFEIADGLDLSPLIDWSEDHPSVGFVAATLGGVRLIDNMVLAGG